MRYLFICGCLEPGRDGVGDYTRRLGARLESLGHEVAFLALNDPFVAGADKDAGGEDKAGSGAFLRLDGKLSWKRREEEALAFIDAFDPEISSLQFVPYAFHPRGMLCPRLSRRLRRIFSRGVRHIMFHELWIGMDAAESRKRRLTGWFQRRFIVGFVRKVMPVSIHTSNTLYQAALADAGLKSRPLPLFSNIPALEPLAPVQQMEWLYRHGIKLREEREGYLVAGLFGSVYPNMRPDAVINGLREAAQRLDLELVILHAGRTHHQPETLEQTMELCRSGGIRFHTLGELSPDEVSRYLHCLDCGIGSGPLELWEKSGSVMAMIEHGLPVYMQSEPLALIKSLRVSPGRHPLVCLDTGALIACLEDSTRAVATEAGYPAQKAHRRGAWQNGGTVAWVADELNTLSEKATRRSTSAGARSP